MSSAQHVHVFELAVSVPSFESDPDQVLRRERSQVLAALAARLRDLAACSPEEWEEALNWVDSSSAA